MTIPYPSVDEATVFCQICGKPFMRITPGHLRMHNINMEQYKLRYPDAELTSVNAKAKAKIAALKSYRDKNKVNNTKEEVKSKSEDIIEEDNIDIIKEVQVEELENEKDFDILLNDSFEEIEVDETVELTEDIIQKDKETPIRRSKEEILNLIKVYYPNTQKDYLISKFQFGGQISYEFITDYCDPILKVIIDFPKSFFHNTDSYVNLSRNRILRQDGWKIITIENIMDIEGKLRNL